MTEGSVEAVQHFIKTVKEGLSHELTCEQSPEGSESRNSIWERNDPGRERINTKDLRQGGYACSV